MINIPSYEDLLERCLSRIPDNIYKEEGSMIYDAIAPVCFELATAYLEVVNVLNITYADTSEGDYLTRRAAERGVVREQATYAIRKGIFNKEVSLGSRFELDGSTYKTLEHITGFEYKLQCEQAGTIGNLYSGTLQSLDGIEGLSAALTDILVPGEETESDEALRKRYFDNIGSEAYGGNIADYKRKTKELNGVGGCKVYPAWNGGGSVKLVVINSDFEKPTGVLINQIQENMDPTQNQGKGIGIAPIGHVVTVEGVLETVINIDSTITLMDSYVWEDVRPHIESTISSYFKELSSDWDENETLIARIAYIETRILQVPGVLDVQFTKLNGSLNNLILGIDHIPKLGTVSKS